MSELHSTETLSSIEQQIQREGYCLLRGALDADDARQLRERCTEWLHGRESGEHARSSRGHVFAARNLLETLPEVRTVWRSGLMFETLRATLGGGVGLVRVLYFDKPPGRTWALPWHKDRSIAVAEHGAESPHFSRPTRKGGVPHVIADETILKRMLTLRIHLDDVTDENGPLRVIPRSHHSTSTAGELGALDFVTIRARAGDVLAMRPLLDHASGPSLPGTDRHRRILHLEFAADATLPDGYRWYQFVHR